MQYLNYYFLRHFQTEIDPNRPVSTWNLSVKGRIDQEHAIQLLKDLQIQKIFTSPEKKAYNTAEIIASIYEIPFVVLDSLKEVNRDNMCYLKNNYKETVKGYFENKLNKEIIWESRENLQKRIKLFLSVLKKENSPTLIIGHGLFLTLMLAPIFKKKYYEFWSTLKFGEIFKVTKYQIESLKFR